MTININLLPTPVSPIRPFGQNGIEWATGMHSLSLKLEFSGYVGWIVGVNLLHTYFYLPMCKLQHNWGKTKSNYSINRQKGPRFLNFRTLYTSVLCVSFENFKTSYEILLKESNFQFD